MANHSRNGRASDSANWTEQVRQILLGAVGAVVVAQEEIENFIAKLVKRGEMAEKDGKKLLNDILSRQKKEVNKGVAGLESDLQSRIEAVLHKMKLVSKKMKPVLDWRVKKTK